MIIDTIQPTFKQKLKGKLTRNPIDEFEIIAKDAVNDGENTHIKGRDRRWKVIARRSDGRQLWKEGFRQSEKGDDVRPTSNSKHTKRAADALQRHLESNAYDEEFTVVDEP